MSKDKRKIEGDVLLALFMEQVNEEQNITDECSVAGALFEVSS